jgi:hypothetical protein
LGVQAGELILSVAGMKSERFRIEESAQKLNMCSQQAILGNNANAGKTVGAKTVIKLIPFLI